jgi:hypothetical protein
MRIDISSRFAGITAAAVAFVLAGAIPGAAQPATGCKPGTRCIKVSANGSPGNGFTAQCTGRFPDYITRTAMVPPAGPWFVLSQEFPNAAPTGDAPWLAIDFKNGVAGANAYLMALRDYAFAGMIAADFRPENNNVRRWFHMPMMNFDDGRREPLRGLTAERSIRGPELGVKPNVTIRNYAVGFYNAAGAATIGAVWKGVIPDPTKSLFPDGTMTFKILFSDGTANQFTIPDPMAGAPQWSIVTPQGVKTVRLLQMDVAAVDSRSPTGWIYGTLAFDPKATDNPSWLRMRPVGLSWGNDPGFTPADQQAGKKLQETTISDQAPDYAAKHLGWAGRANGPVDNPISGCLSCHGTAQYPRVADLAPFNNACNSDQKKLHWFRNFPGSQPFGAMTTSTCLPATSPTPIAPLDFSLQMQVAVVNVLRDNMVNPCSPPPTPIAAAPAAPGAVLRGATPADIQGGGKIRR